MLLGIGRCGEIFTTMGQQKVLLVEDSPEVRIVVEASLKDFDVVTSPTLADAAVRLAKETFACMILDIELPDGDGVAFFAKIQTEVPTIFLTGNLDLSKKLAAFSLGAEDFVAKPFEAAELAARVAARVKKSSKAKQTKDLQVEDVKLVKDHLKFIIQSDDDCQEVSLTSLEFKILNLLLQNMERVFERDSIIDAAWGKNINVVDRTVDAHVSHLRKKLAPSRVTIEAIPGVGYKAIVKQGKDYDGLSKKRPL